MNTRSLSLWLDTVMLVVFASLLSWRLTGVPVHEWAAAVLLGVIVVHLVIHWRWVESRVALLRSAPGRVRVNVLLNFTLFCAMGVTLVSGFVISKVMFPNELSSREYLRWHSLHERSSLLTLVILGLHVALNWDLIAGGLRRAARRVRGSRSSFVAAPRTAGWEWSAVPRRLVMIVSAAALLTAGTFAAGTLMPAEGKVLMVRNGLRSLEDPPAGITRLHPSQRVPDPLHGAPKMLVQLAMLAAMVIVGRKALRLRL